MEKAGRKQEENTKEKPGQPGQSVRLSFESDYLFASLANFAARQAALALMNAP